MTMEVMTARGEHRYVAQNTSSIMEVKMQLTILKYTSKTPYQASSIIMISVPLKVAIHFQP